jgi:hypothetical protein
MDNIHFHSFLPTLTMETRGVSRDIKDDNEAINKSAAAVGIDIGEILIRVDSIRGISQDGVRKTTEQWVEDVSVLSNSAKATYREALLETLDQLAGTTVELHRGQESIERTVPSIKLTYTIEEISSTNVTTTSPLRRPQRLASRIPPVSEASSSTTDPRESDTSSTKVLIRGIKEPINTSGAKVLIQPHSTTPDNSAEGSDKGRDELSAKFFARSLPHLSFDGIQDFAYDVKEIAAKVIRDEVLIRKSQIRRDALEPGERMRLFSQLSCIDRNTPAHTVRQLIEEGADPNEFIRHTESSKISTVLGLAISSWNNDCVFELLRCGADPNFGVFLKNDPIGTGEGSLGHIYPTLAYATLLANEPVVWALYSAGSFIEPPTSAVVCPRCNGAPVSPPFGTTCWTPLLRALSVLPTVSTSEKERRLRIVRFLLCNGADACNAGCRVYGPNHELHTPLSAAIVNWTNIDTNMAIELVMMLFNAGAVAGFQYTPFLPPNQEDPLVVAAQSGDEGLLYQITSRKPTIRSMSVSWAILYAAMKSAWSCIEVLAKPSYIQGHCLHLLVDEYMNDFSTNKLSWPQFSQAVRILLSAGADPSDPVEFPYVKQRFPMRFENVTENISAIELAERIKTDKSRSKVISLLKGKRAKR